MQVRMTDWAPLPNGRAPVRPLFAIGDLHGYADAAWALLAHLRRVIETERGGQPIDLVFLGDLIDRGPDPLGVMEAVRTGVGVPEVAQTVLMGNHDWFLVAAAQLSGHTLGITDWAVWLANGGRETLGALGGLSYLRATPERLREALGAQNIALLEGMSLTYRSGGVFCVHAGVDPTKPIDRQASEDLIWIRRPFLEPAEDADDPWPFGLTVVHGHTPNAYGVFPHRIGVDTGGYATGVFSAVELDADGVRLHHLERE